MGDRALETSVHQHPGLDPHSRLDGRVWGLERWLKGRARETATFTISEGGWGSCAAVLPALVLPPHKPDGRHRHC